MRKNIRLILLLFFIQFLGSRVHSQIMNNYFGLEFKLKSQRLVEKLSYRTWESDLLNSFSPDSLFNYWITSSAAYKNSALDLNYRDENFLQVNGSFNFNGRLNKYFLYGFQLYGENDRNSYLDLNKKFDGHVFSGMRGDVYRGFISGKTKHFELKFGRDYFMPGFSPGENLLFSRYNYPYDQFRVSYYNQHLEYSIYYLNLHLYPFEGNLHQRHINGHRLTLNLGDKGYVAFNELLLYGGINKDPELSLFNPFLMYYVYRKNIKGFSGNSILSTEIYQQINNLYLWTELMLDDFQVAKDDSLDNEPTEYAVNIALGYKENNEFDVNVNYTRVANRTYNTPTQTEKYLYKNMPIGHIYGSNFWSVSLNTKWMFRREGILALTFEHTELGEEALYSPFNTDFANTPAGESYSEPFPFGDIRVLNGIKGEVWYHVSGKILVFSKWSWWMKKANIRHSFNYMAGVEFKIF